MSEYLNTNRHSVSLEYVDEIGGWVVDILEWEPNSRSAVSVHTEAVDLSDAGDRVTLWAARIAMGLSLSDIVDDMDRKAIERGKISPYQTELPL